MSLTVYKIMRALYVADCISLWTIQLHKAFSSNFSTHNMSTHCLRQFAYYLGLYIITHFRNIVSGKEGDLLVGFPDRFNSSLKEYFWNSLKAMKYNTHERTHKWFVLLLQGFWMTTYMSDSTSSSIPHLSYLLYTPSNPRSVHLLLHWICLKNESTMKMFTNVVRS